MPLYDCGRPDCLECIIAFRRGAIATSPLLNLPARSEAQARREIAAERFPVSSFIKCRTDGSLHQVVGHSPDGTMLSTFLQPWGFPYGVRVEDAVRVSASIVIGTPEERAEVARRYILFDDGVREAAE